MLPITCARVAGLLFLGLTVTAAPVAFAQEDPPALEEAPGPDQLRSRALELVYASQRPSDDTFEGIALLEQAAGLGDAKARVALGDLYLYGTLVPRDWDRALELYEAAAADGEGGGLYNYGMILMWEEVDPDLAEAILLRAAELGASRAWATLAEGAMYGYLGEEEVSRAKFDDFADRGRAEGVARIAVLEAIRSMWGISVPENPEQTLAILEAAADQGNAEAALFLIRLLRDGNDYNIAADLGRAGELLETYSEILGADETVRLEMTIGASKSRQVRSFERLAGRLEEQPGIVTSAFSRDLLAVNPNAAIFILQTKLSEAGYRPGVADGVAGPRTVRAMTQACRDLLPSNMCRYSVLEDGVVTQLIVELWKDASPS